MKGGERMKISIQQFGEHKAVVMNDMVIENLKDYKIISSADGSTELILHIKLNADITKCDLLVNSE